MSIEILNLNELEWDNRDDTETDVHFSVNGTQVTLHIRREDLINMLEQMDENDEEE